MERASPPKAIWAYTDGACSGNPGPGGWAYLARFEDEVWAASGPAQATTNNRMEMQAAIEVLKAVRTRKLQAPIIIHTDSSYVIKGMQEWMPGWVKRGWKKADGTEVANREYWEALAQASHGIKVEWVLVPGHEGVVGNEFVDEWAVEASQKLQAREERWNFDAFTHCSAFTEVPRARVSGASSSKSASKSKGVVSRPPASGKAFYVSFLDGEFRRHATWTECEARVKGASGARYRKVTSEEELVGIKAAWNVPR